MAVTSVNAVTQAGSQNTSSAATSSVGTSDTASYQQFLKLLVAELANQDPINPTDPTQFVSQLASFSAVEQQVRTNSALDSLLAAQADDLIGRNVTSADGAVSGKVVSVTMAAGGSVTATLENGETLSIGDGITVSAS
jgi:flagellar basal-body rod modification protein FlgD